MLWCNGPCILGKEMLAWQGRLWTDTLKHMAYSLNLHASNHQTGSWELGKHTSPSTVNPSRKMLLPELKASNARLVLILVTFFFLFFFFASNYIWSVWALFLVVLFENKNWLRLVRYYAIFNQVKSISILLIYWSILTNYFLKRWLSSIFLTYIFSIKYAIENDLLSLLFYNWSFELFFCPH